MNSYLDDKALESLDQVIAEPASRQVSEKQLLAQILRLSGVSFDAQNLDPDKLYRELVSERSGKDTKVVGGQLTVLARPGEVLKEYPERGDILLRVMPGLTGFGHVAVMIDSRLWNYENLARAHFGVERQRTGSYILISEAGAFPHPSTQPFARRLLDEKGKMPAGQILIRINNPQIDEVAAFQQAGSNPLEQEAGSYRFYPPFNFMHPSLPFLELASDCMNVLKNTSVAVVGAGFAGLMAALRLGQHGIRVRVFEARNQVGGRVRSNVEFSKGRVIEEGAELIGSFHTTWLLLAREYGLSMISRMDRTHYEKAGLDTKLKLDKELSTDEIQKIEAERDVVLNKIIKDAAAITDPSKPWEQASLETYDKMSVADALRSRHGVDRVQQERLWKSLELLLVNNEVTPLEEMNYLGLLCKVKGGQGWQLRGNVGGDGNGRGYWDDLEIFRCADGCQALAKKMAEEINSMPGCKVMKNLAVTDINLTTERVLLGYKEVVNHQGTLAEGKPTILPFDYVILAIPPSVWSHINISVDGKTAHPKDEIGLIGMGPAVKCFSEMQKRFWLRQNPGLFMSHAAPFGGSSKAGQIWEGTDNQTRVGDQGIVLSVFAGPILSGPRVPTEHEIEKELISLYPAYHENHVKTLYRNWPKEPFIMTGYSAPKPGQIFTIGRKLSEPFHKRLFFAGEHTQMAFFGYMEGALRSGRQAAEQMMQLCAHKVNTTILASAMPLRQTSPAMVQEQESYNVELHSPSSVINYGEPDSHLYGEKELSNDVITSAVAETKSLGSEAIRLDAERIQLEDQHPDIDESQFGAAANQDDETPSSEDAAVFSPFPEKFAVPWTDSERLKLAFDEAITAVSNFSRYPDFRHLPDVHDLPIMIVALDGSSRPAVGQHEFDMYYSGSLLKVVAMYAAFQLRIAVNEFIKHPFIGLRSDDVVFAKLEETFNPQIKKVVQRIQNRRPSLSEVFLVPKYKDIFQISRNIFGVAQLDFNDTFRDNLKKMIVGSHNNAAGSCIRALGYSWIDGVLQKAGFYQPDSIRSEGLWLAGDYESWPTVDLMSVNDDMVKQVMNCYNMAWLFTMLHDSKLVKNETGPLSGKSGNEEMLTLLHDAVNDAGARTLLKRPFEGNAPPDDKPPFDILRSKIGVGNLKGGDCREGRVNRCTYSEAAIVRHRVSHREFVVVFQGLVFLKADPSLWGQGLRRIIEIINLTMDKYRP